MRGCTVFARAAAAAALFLALAPPVRTAGPDSFSFRAVPASVELKAGEAGVFEVEMVADPGYYLYQDMLEVKSASPVKGLAIEKAQLPQAHRKYDAATETEKMVYEGAGIIRIPFRAEKGLPTAGTVSFSIDYQGCSSKVCYMPDTATVEISFKAVGGQPAGGQKAPRQAAEGPPTGSGSTGVPPAPAGPTLTETVRKPQASPAKVGGGEPSTPAEGGGPGKPAAGGAKTAADYGTVWAFLALFLAGVVTSFTPCVYPIIPFTISVFGARGAESRTRAFLLSLAYVQGICVMYSALGVVAAMSGAAFGQYMGHPAVVGGIVVFFVVLGLFMAGVFQFNVSSSLQTKAAGVGGKGYFGAFSMGVVSGVIAAPCTGPALGGVLAWVATTRDALLGFFLLYVYALGLGLLFVVLGTFSSLISKIPKSGSWMEVVKGVFAVTMFTTAAFFLKDSVPALEFRSLSRLELVLAGVVISLLGVMLKGILVDFHGAGWGGIARKSASLALLTAGCFAILAGSARVTSGLSWQTDVGAALALAEKEGKPAMVDFYANWCAACKELDKFTYEDPRVQKALGRFVIVKVDMTDPTPANEALRRRYQLVGLPLVAFHDRRGRLLPEPRVTGFVPADEFLVVLGKVP